MTNHVKVHMTKHMVVHITKHVEAHITKHVEAPNFSWGTKTIPPLVIPSERL